MLGTGNNNIQVTSVLNDPANLIDFVSNPNNALEAHDLGLLELDEATLDALTKDNDSSKRGWT
jgi:hypothetical protein